MPAIKIILLLVVLCLIVWGFRNRQRTSMRAGVRVLALGVAGFAALAIAEPSITTRFANLIGVGRGADLLLYVAVVTFGVSTVGLYLRARQLEQRLNALARAFAINAAVLADGPPDAGDHNASHAA